MKKNRFFENCSGEPGLKHSSSRKQDRSCNNLTTRCGINGDSCLCSAGPSSTTLGWLVHRISHLQTRPIDQRRLGKIFRGQERPAFLCRPVNLPGEPSSYLGRSHWKPSSLIICLRLLQEGETLKTVNPFQLIPPLQNLQLPDLLDHLQDVPCAKEGIFWPTAPTSSTWMWVKGTLTQELQEYAKVSTIWVSI